MTVKCQEGCVLTEQEPQLQLEAQSPLQEPQVLQSLSKYVSLRGVFFVMHAGHQGVPRSLGGVNPTHTRTQSWVDSRATYQGDMMDIFGWERKAKS